MAMAPEETASIVARYLALAQLYGEAIPSSGLTEDEKTAACKVAARRLTEEIGNADVFYRLHPVTWENVKEVYDKLNAVLSTKPNDYAEYVSLPPSAHRFKVQTTQTLLLQYIQTCPSSIHRFYVHLGQGHARSLCWFS